MQLNTLQRVSARTYEKRVGRGGKRGKTSGRGTKGQKARSGRRIRPQFRDVFVKIPKLKGYKVKLRPSKIGVVNVKDLERVFGDNAVISPEFLVEKRLVRRISGKVPDVKILGAGASKKFTIKNCALSRAAKESIEKAGGRILS